MVSKAYLVGLFIGLFAGIILVALLLKWAKTDKSNKCKFDERQLAIRGIGYKYAFFTAMIGLILIIFVHDYTDQIFSTSIFAFAVLLISVGVYAIYCICKNGYIALNESPKKEICAFVVIGLINTISGVCAVMEKKPVLTESFPNGVCNLGCAALMWIVCIVLSIKVMTEKNEED